MKNFSLIASLSIFCLILGLVLFKVSANRGRATVIKFEMDMSECPRVAKGYDETTNTYTFICTDAIPQDQVGVK